jgi:hypothetical protein
MAEQENYGEPWDAKFDELRDRGGEAIIRAIVDEEEGCRCDCDEDKLRRIVACVNACRGVPTELLNSHPVVVDVGVSKGPGLATACVAIVGDPQFISEVQEIAKDAHRAVACRRLLDGVSTEDIEEFLKTGNEESAAIIGMSLSRMAATSRECNWPARGKARRAEGRQVGEGKGEGS